MLEAALRGKPLGLNAEDALTATVFGLLRYLPSRVLRRWVQNAYPVGSSATVHPDHGDVCIEFWPSMPDTFRGFGRVEPDVVLTIGSLVYVVEAKLNSPQGEDQLAREWKSAWDWCLIEHRGQSTLGGLLYVTAHLTLPTADFRQATVALGDKGVMSPSLYWLPWSSLNGYLDHEVTNDHAFVFSDLRRYLDAARLLRFDGWPRVSLDGPGWGYARTEGLSYWQSGMPKPNGTWCYRPASRTYWDHVRKLSGMQRSDAWTYPG